LPNRAPHAVADVADTIQGIGFTTTNVLANDIDPEGDDITLFDFTQPASGTGTVANKRRWHFCLYTESGF
jgi:hypothetical protein